MLHCATASRGVLRRHLEEFFAGTFEHWQARLQNQKNFECDQVLALITFGHDQNGFLPGFLKF